MTTDRFGTLLGHSNALGIGEKERPEDMAAVWSESAKRLGGGRARGARGASSSSSSSSPRTSSHAAAAVVDPGVGAIHVRQSEPVVKESRPVRAIRDLAPRPAAPVAVAPRKKSAVMAVVEWLTAGMRPRKGGNGPDRAALVGVKPKRNTLELADLEIGPAGGAGRHVESSGNRVFKASRTMAWAGSCAGSQRV